MDAKPRNLPGLPLPFSPSRSRPSRYRKALVNLAAEHGFVILSDDVYQLMSSSDGAPAPRPLFWHARELGLQHTVVSLGAARTRGWLFLKQSLSCACNQLPPQPRPHPILLLFACFRNLLQDLCTRPAAGLDGG